MIFITGINGTVAAINSDLIEHADANPDTVITLTTGNKFVVRETLNELVAKVLAYRRSVAAPAYPATGSSAPVGGSEHA